MKYHFTGCLLLTLSLLTLNISQIGRSAEHFGVQIVDSQTGRGIPLVELRTVHEVSYWSDSNGWIAIDEPALHGQETYFSIQSHGYHHKPDGFGYRGVRLHVRPGGRATIQLKRVNLAERLYRVTGADIYRDSVLLGENTPLKHPLLNAQVLGSDSVLTAVYSGKIYWFWGDTNRLGYPLGNFHVPGATSLLPQAGGLNPDTGVDLSYFVTEPSGFAKPTCSMPGSGPTWIEGLTVVDGRMFAGYMKIKPPLTVYERGIVEWDDAAKQFRKRLSFTPDTAAYPQGHPVQQREGGTDFIYFCKPLPFIRVPANAASLLNLASYETYSYLRPGSTPDEPFIDRDTDHQLRWSWKTGTTALTPKLERQLVKAGKIEADEQAFRLPTLAHDRTIALHGTSISWNARRQRWIMIALETGGTSSFLGEVHYSEARKLTGPWSPAIKVVSHNKYSFYNPRLHPMLSQGRHVYFEGTYTKSFSAAKSGTPRYDYNQIMYRLDVDRVGKLLSLSSK